jgi:hypothetical protein
LGESGHANRKTQTRNKPKQKDAEAAKHDKFFPMASRKYLRTSAWFPHDQRRPGGDEINDESDESHQPEPLVP